MTDASSRRDSRAGCRVAIFLPNATSGATLGYYGTLVSREERDLYWVHVPALGKTILVPDRDMLLFQQTAEGECLVVPDNSAVWELANRQWEIEFDAPAGTDNAILRGKYRVGCVEKGRFEFKKGNCATASYLFRMPAKSLGSSRGKLKCNVPASQVLDRAYVMRTLADLLAMALPANGQVTNA